MEKGYSKEKEAGINALAQAGFAVEQMIEQTDNETMESVEDVSIKTKKAKMIPISFCIKARKLS